MENSSFPVRKNPRLPGFDYTARRFYFITVCTRNREPCLCQISGTVEQPTVRLLPAGKIVQEELQRLPQRVPGLAVEQWCIMPDHLHMILSVGCYGGEKTPPVTRIIGNFKGGVSRRCKRPVWQASFHDHVIRGPADAEEIMRYIENNPRKWVLDRNFEP